MLRSVATALSLSVVALATAEAGYKRPCDMPTNAAKPQYQNVTFAMTLEEAGAQTLLQQSEDEDEKESAKEDDEKKPVAAPFDGFGQIAAEMEKVALKRSANLLNSNKKTTATGTLVSPTTSDESKVAEVRAAVSAVIAKAARPDLVARVASITDLLQQLESDLEMIRTNTSLTPETVALVELSLLKEREALIEQAGLKPTEAETEDEPDPDGHDQNGEGQNGEGQPDQPSDNQR